MIAGKKMTAAQAIEVAERVVAERPGALRINAARECLVMARESLADGLERLAFDYALDAVAYAEHPRSSAFKMLAEAAPAAIRRERVTLH